MTLTLKATYPGSVVTRVIEYARLMTENEIFVTKFNYISYSAKTDLTQSANSNIDAYCRVFYDSYKNFHNKLCFPLIIN